MLESHRKKQDARYRRGATAAAVATGTAIFTFVTGGLGVLPLVGGMAMPRQERLLKKRPHVVVGRAARGFVHVGRRHDGERHVRHAHHAARGLP